MATILVIDGNSFQTPLIEDALLQDGHTVCVVHSGREGLHAAREVSPELVVLDLTLPDIDGFEVLDHLRDVHPRVPIVVHTSYGRAFENLHTWEANAIVLKSVDMDELRLAVCRVLLETRFIPTNIELSSLFPIEAWMCWHHDEWGC